MKTILLTSSYSDEYRTSWEGLSNELIGYDK